MGRGRDAANLCSTQDSFPHQRIIQSKMRIVPKLRNSALIHPSETSLKAHHFQEAFQASQRRSVFPTSAVSEYGSYFLCTYYLGSFLRTKGNSYSFLGPQHRAGAWEALWGAALNPQRLPGSLRTHWQGNTGRRAHWLVPFSTSRPKFCFL